jgi:hypothetical protein
VDIKLERKHLAKLLFQIREKKHVFGENKKKEKEARIRRRNKKNYTNTNQEINI